MTAYTTNYCLNPGFQLGLQGYLAIQSAQLQLDTTNLLFQNQSLAVLTPGNVVGEGVITAGGLMPVTANCSVSLYIMSTGSGTVNVNALTNPGGSLVGSSIVELTNTWQRVVISNIPIFTGQDLYMSVTTAEPTRMLFWINAIQIEPESPVHDYCDGNQPGCRWASGQPGSVSYQDYEFPVDSVSNLKIDTNVVPILVQGEAFDAGTSDTDIHFYNPLASVGNVGPVGALSDFAVFQLTDPDPIQTYVSWNNAGLDIPTTGNYARSWATFFPPQDYYVSGGQKLYSRAAYMALGFQFDSLPNNASVNVANVQAEVLPITESFAATPPSNFDPPRSVHAIVRPDRLNYCPNPSLELSTSGWSTIGTASIARDNSVSVGTIVTIDEIARSAGTWSLKVTMNANGDGAYITIPNLIAGGTYMASAYVQVANTGFANVLMTADAGTTSILSTGGTGYGTGGYGQGPYGGVTKTNNLVNTGQWYRLDTLFTPEDSSVTLNFSGQGFAGWNFTAQGTPADNTYFIVWASWADQIQIGDQFTASNNGATVFTVTSISAPAFGFKNIHFTPNAATIIANPATVTTIGNISYPASFWIDAVLVEAGTTLGYYFDGSFGPDFTWETGAPAGLGRSYYYGQYKVKSQAVSNVLSHHTPVGVIPAAPVFNQPYTQ